MVPSLRNGFTLVELLVVITIIGILIVLLLWLDQEPVVLLVTGLLQNAELDHLVEAETSPFETADISANGGFVSASTKQPSRKRPPGEAGDVLWRTHPWREEEGEYTFFFPPYWSNSAFCRSPVVTSLG